MPSCTARVRSRGVLLKHVTWAARGSGMASRMRSIRRGRSRILRGSGTSEGWWRGGGGGRGGAVRQPGGGREAGGVGAGEEGEAAAGGAQGDAGQEVQVVVDDRRRDLLAGDEDHVRLGPS